MNSKKLMDIATLYLLYCLNTPVPMIGHNFSGVQDIVCLVLFLVCHSKLFRAK